MKKVFVSLLIIVCIVFFRIQITGCSRSVNDTGNRFFVTDSIPVTDSIQLVFVGDVMGHGNQMKGAWRDGGDSCYNYAPSFEGMKDYISSADLAIANLEVTFAGEPYTGYPTFSSPHSMAVALQDMGIDMLVTANNHIMDRGRKGLEGTIDVLDSLGIPHTGTFKDSIMWKANHPLVMEKNNFRLAFLNYTYGTNMAPAKLPNRINYIDTVRMAADLAEARALNPDYIITYIHWGEEYQNKENAIQHRLAAFLAKNGCNLIVGSHPHVVQPIVKIPGNAVDSVGSVDSVLVAYSLGNFISNQRWRYSDGGIALEVVLTKTEGVVSLLSHNYESFWVHRYPEKNVQLYRIIPVNTYLSNPEDYSIGDENKKQLMQFYNDTKDIIK
jgi:poly-gamma-glutamate synthesis protein (capsule biosynthesis protein)